MNAQHEPDLVRRAQDGDRSAFEQLYRAHVGRIYALCLRLSGDPVRAEELTQDVFIRTWRRLGSFRGECAFSSWLYRLATNVVLGAFRSERRRTERERSGVEGSIGLASRGRASTEARVDLEAAIHELPAGARTVFVLHDIEGYKHEEIANMVGIAPGTAKAQLHRARKLLREALER